MGIMGYTTRLNRRQLKVMCSEVVVNVVAKPGKVAPEASMLT